MLPSLLSSLLLRVLRSSRMRADLVPYFAAAKRAAEAGKQRSCPGAQSCAEGRNHTVRACRAMLAVRHISDAASSSPNRVAPALYKAAAGDEAAFCKALDRLLAQEGLRIDATDKEVAAARQRRELARDLDGIDAKNVVETEHGRPRRAAAATVSDAMPQHAAVDAARGAGSGAADEPRKVASSPPGVRRRVLRVDECEDDDA